MRKTHASTEYPVVLKQIKDSILITCPDLKQTEVLKLPEDGKIDPKFMTEIAKKIGEIWLKNHMRLIEVAMSNQHCPSPSNVRMTLKEKTERALTPPELAKVAGVSPDTIRRAVDRGELQVEKTGGGHRKIPYPIAMKYLEEKGYVLNFD